MNIAIILSGGNGTRLGGDIPKQYIMVAGKPIITYALRTFNEHEKVDGIVIVVAEEWKELLSEWIEKEEVTKFIGFAVAGSSRQQSIVNGMEKVYELGAKDEDSIIIHDAARPNISAEAISCCIEALSQADGVMPALPIKDTVYLSENGKNIKSLLNRDHLFAGQAPESFKLGKYYVIQKDMSSEELCKVRGSSEIAFQHGLSISIVQGDEHNYKITTMADLDKFKREMEK